MRLERRTKSNEPARSTRASIRVEFREGGKTTLAENSFIRDTRKLWSQAPKNIKEAQTKGTAKQLIKSYCKTLLL